MSSTHISTYHCICSEVLFASTRPLTEFATRQSDSAAICTIINNSNNSSSNSNSNHSSNSAGKEEEKEQKEGEETKTKSNSNNNSILLSNAIAIERKEKGKEKGKEKEKEEDFPCLILKLDDGFEKRYPVQCPRCGVCFAYQLDGSQWVEDGNEKEKEKEKEKDDDDVRRTGRRCDVLYVLREGLVRTEDVIVGGGGNGS